MRSLLRALAAVLALAGVALGLLALHDSRAPRPVPWLPAAGLEARYAVVDGHRLRYVRAGRGPAVVLVHGFGSSLYTWKDVLRDLARDHDVVALDLPGFGLSDLPKDLTIDDLPRSVEGLMDALGLPRAALVGSSMGGGTVTVVAAQHPERASALVLVDAAGFNMDPERQPRFVRVATSPLGGVLGWLPGRRLLVQLALRDVLHHDDLLTEERVAEYLQAAMRPGSVAALRSLGASIDGRHGLVQDALARVRAPTLVIWGREDGWIPIADSERFAAAIAGARTAIIEDCGHLPQEERPGQFLRILRGFLEEADLASRPPAVASAH